MLVADILDVCRDSHSSRFYQLVAENAPAEFTRAARSETRFPAATDQIKKSPGALFTAEIKRLAKQQGIDLELKR